MASGNQTLAFAVRAVNEASKALKDIQGDMGALEKHAKDADRATGGLGKSLGDMGKIAGGLVLAQGIMKAPGFLMDAAKAAADDEAATLRLQQTLKNLGGDYDANLKKVNDAIGAGQKLAFSDDDVRDSFQSLAAATGDADEALKRQKAAMDLARGANIPLGQATKMLGKLNEENVEVFKKMGITIGENATEADALAAVQQKFGGQSEAYAKSTAGQFEIMKLKMGEAKETIGAALLPVMLQVGEVLATKVIPAIEDFATKVGPALSAAGTFLKENLLPPLQALAEWFADHKDVMLAAAVGIGAVMVVAFGAWALAAGAAALATLAAAAPVIAIGAAIALLAGGIFLLVKHWDELTEKYPALGAASDAVKAKFEAFSGWITGTFVPGVMAVYTGVKAAVDAAVGYVRAHWDDIKAVIEPALKALAVIIETQVNQWKIVIETVLGVIKGIVDVFMGVFSGDWQRAWDGVKKIVGSVWDGIKGTIENAAEMIKKLAPLFLDAAKALGGAILDGLKAGLTSAGGFVSDIGAAVLAAIKAAYNSVVGSINRALEFTIPVKGLPDIHVNPPDIPFLASGGIVTRPTLALIGEAGPEAVIPLHDRRADSFLRTRDAGVTVNVYANAVGMTAEDLAHVVKRELARQY